MKKFYFLFFVVFVSQIYSQTVTIPDVNFKAKLLEANVNNNIAKDLAGNPTKIDQNNDGEIQVAEAEKISSISINNRNIDFIFHFFSFPYYNIPIKEIYTLEGLKNFKNLKILDCSFAKLTTLDFTDLSKLQQIYCTNNQIVDFTNFQYVNSLFALDCSNNLMTNLDLSRASLVDITGDQNGVLLDFRNNNFQFVNIQNNRRTSWSCLCSPEFCPFYEYSSGVVITCRFAPRFSGNPGLIEVKINCRDKEYIHSNNDNIPSNIFVDNCALFATNDAELKANFKIYPNPVKDFVTIETKERIKEITIFDYSGKLVSKHQRNFNSISLDQLPKGNYVLKIETPEKTCHYQFIKQ